MKYIVLLFALAGMHTAQAADVLMPDLLTSSVNNPITITVDNGDVFYDQGGPGEPYQRGCRICGVILAPSTPGAPLTLSFTQFVTEFSFDWLQIHDGASASDPVLVFRRSGNRPPFQVTATNPEGKLFVVFNSDFSVQLAGWRADISYPLANIAPVADVGEYLDPVAVGELAYFDGSGSFDPDDDPLTYLWDFGDGNAATGDMPTHTYASAGMYNVCLTVNDGTVDSPADCTDVVVYDPSAGFVTGGGWLYSQQGAFVPDPAVEGKATFGYVSRYKKGQSVPDGNTNFVFKAGGLQFKSESYDWLVVTGGNHAVFKGVGELAGSDMSYQFMLTSTDDDLGDTFRIKIWNEVDGVEDVIYDNGSQQAIDGGSIQVHSN